MSLITMESFYVYTKGNHTQLAKALYFEGDWEVALTEIHVKNPNIDPRHFGILAHFVDTSFVHNTSLPILRWIHALKVEFGLPYYKRVTVNRLSHINIELINHDLEPISPDIIDLVLHFRKR